MSVTRAQILDCLETGWAAYPAKVNALSPEVKAEFLKKQGYARLGDLLAHVIVWWEIGRRLIEDIQQDPAVKTPTFDVDGINAQAVTDYAAFSEDEVLERFNACRQQMADFVQTLSEADMQHPEINFQLEIEFPGHLAEHS